MARPARRTGMRIRTVLTTAVVVTSLSACGDTADTASARASPAPAVGRQPAAPVETGDGRGRTPDRTEPSGPYDLVPQGLRVEERAGGDRVVLTFRGRGTAGWSARYVEQAVLDGSGRRVDLDADTILSIAVFGTPTRPSDWDWTVPVTTGGGVTDVFVGDAWEGVTQVFLGLEGGRVPYRISTARQPSRLVIDLGGRA